MLLRLLGGGSRATARPSHSTRVLLSSSSAFRRAPPAPAAHCCGPALARVALTAALVAATAASSCLPNSFSPVPPVVAQCFKTSSSGPDLPAADSTSNRHRPPGAEPTAMADTDTTAAPNQQQQPHTFTQRKAELHSDQQKPQQDRSQGRDQDPGGGSAQRQQQAEEQQGAGGQAVVQPRSLPSPGMVQLLGHLIDRGALSSPEVAEAMSQVWGGGGVGDGEHGGRGQVGGARWKRRPGGGVGCGGGRRRGSGKAGGAVSSVRSYGHVLYLHGKQPEAGGEAWREGDFSRVM